LDQPVWKRTGDFDRLNVLFAIVTTVVAFFIYLSTVSRTISYWDCGEFVACAHILGNPHPPGSPLFVLIGRLFDLLPFASDPAFRINLVSVFSSAFMAMFAYLIIVRLVSGWYVGSENYRTGRVIAYASGFIGALFASFCRTHWSNSVEAEVYSLSMMIMLAILWLALKWSDSHYTPSGQRIAILIAFLSTLSVSLHLTVFLVVPIVAIVLCLKNTTTKTEWAIISGYFLLEMLLVFALSGRFQNYSIFLVLSGLIFVGLIIFLRQRVYWPVLIAFAGLLPIMISFYPFLFALSTCLIVCAVMWVRTKESLWRLATLMLIAGAVGWSANMYIPIRSTQHPIIDENTPSRSWRVFVDFLDRKQYGDMSMTKRMFVRRGAWQNQFGDHARMGYWGFFKDQYSHRSIFPVFLVIGLFGIATLAKHNPQWGHILIIFLLAASAGLVLYMNFADGTAYNAATGDAYQEVRDRDYFFTPAFLLFGMIIGIGMAGIMEMFRRTTEKFGTGINRIAVAISLLLIVTPLIPVKANYFYNDRSRNYMAYDYAYNMLNSCGKNAIMFTSGDNDTFPLWCVQEIYGLRKDVRIVNFSLLNTDWYVWQLKNFQNVPISLSDDQILWEPFKTPDGNEINKPVRPFYDRSRNRQAWLVPMPYNNKFLKVSSVMLDDIILSNQWKYPIVFSSLGGEIQESPLHLPERCYQEGLVYRLTKERVNLAHNDSVCDSLFFKVYKYRNLADSLVAEDENASGIAMIYPERALDYHAFLINKGDTARADSLLNMICKAVPWYWRSQLIRREISLQRGDTADVIQLEEELLTYLHAFSSHNPDNLFFYQFLGLAYYSLGDAISAENYLEQAWDMNHDKYPTFRALFTVYAQQGRSADIGRIAREYKEYHEDDQLANNILQSLQRSQSAPLPGQNPAARPKAAESSSDKPDYEIR